MKHPEACPEKRFLVWVVSECEAVLFEVRCFSEHHQRRPEKAEPPIERLQDTVNRHQRLASMAVMKNPEARPEETYYDSPEVRMVNPNSGVAAAPEGRRELVFERTRGPRRWPRPRVRFRE